ncbi:polysaccharide pyruvyl transferase family protein [Methylophaga thalassica]|uniref:polysaccharide pyruvyl transferase family protein n=1 Tax=Methylophaga aminisulfidivorans TaxID=230105 RepID=UPI003A94FC82
MIIEIKGVQFVNKGAELMLCAIMQQLHSRYNDVEVVLAPTRNSPYLSRAKVGAYQKLSIRKNVLDLNRLSYLLPTKVRQYLKSKWGIVTEADIDVVLDASGFAYGDQWQDMGVRHLHGELKRAGQFDKTYIFMPQALGPFSNPKDTKYLQDSLVDAALVCAREEQSYAHVQAIGAGDVNLKLYPDFTNLVTGVVPDYYQNGAQKVVIIPNSNMIGSRNLNKSWASSYVDVLCSAVQAIQDMGLSPVLLNHEGKGDGDLCHQINRHFAGSLEFIEEPDPIKVKGIIGASKAIVCSRFHGCVSALSQKVPCVGTSWSHKYEQLFAEYSAGQQLLAPGADYDRVKQTLEFALQNVQSADYIERVERYKQQSTSMWQEIHTILAARKGE